MQQRVRWAVVGTSDFALDWIARGIRLGSNSALAAVVSRDAERAAAAAQRVGTPHSYTSIEATEQAQRDWVTHVGEVANYTLMVKADSWAIGANIPGKPRVYSFYLAGLDAYRNRCAGVAEGGYEGFRLERAMGAVAA